MIIKIDNSVREIPDTLIRVCYRNFKANRVINYSGLTACVKTDDG